MTTPVQDVRRLLLILAVPLCAGACVESGWTVCSDGRLCEPGLTCDVGNGTCADEECLGKGEGAPCAGGGSTCQAGRCRDSCGDGIANGNDQCDRADLGGWTCASEGIDRYRGDVVCGADCMIDSSGCSGYCGDGALDRTFERCDPTDFGPSDGDSCFSQGFDAGRRGCAADCKGLSADPCMRFGWVAEHPVADSKDPDSLQDIWGTSDDLFILVSPGGVRSRVQAWAPVGATGDSIQGRALWASSYTDIWVVNSAGDGFFQWDGTTWREVSSPSGGLNEIWGSASTDVFAVGDLGALVHFDGVEWRPEDAPTTRDLRAIWGNGPDDVYAAGEGGGLVHRDASGWSGIESGTTEDLIGVWASSPTEIWTLSDTSVRRFDGDAWIPSLDLDAESGGAGPISGRGWISGTGPSDIWISAGNPGTVRRYDGTRWWTLLGDEIVGPTLPLLGADLYGAQPLWVERPSARTSAPQVAVGFEYGSGHGAVNLWYGAGTGAKLAGLDQWNDVWALDPDTWIAVGEVFPFGIALHSDGSTDSFEHAVLSVTGFDADHAYAIDAAGSIFGWNGTSWSPTPDTGLGPARDLWTSGSSDLYALVDEPPVEDAQRVVRFDGNSWTPLPALESCGLFIWTGWASSPDDVFVVGLDVLAHFDGFRWSCFDDESESSDFTSVWGSGPGDVWVVESPTLGQPERLHHWNGAEWTTEPLDLERESGLSPAGLLIGTAPDDIFLDNVAHYDGRLWSPLRPAAMQGRPVFALPSRLFMVDTLEGEGLGQFIRTRSWNQRDHELDCADGVDDDADGLTDRDDPDCASESRGHR